MTLSGWRPKPTGVRKQGQTFGKVVAFFPLEIDDQGPFLLAWRQALGMKVYISDGQGQGRPGSLLHAEMGP